MTRDTGDRRPEASGRRGTRLLLTLVTTLLFVGVSGVGVAVAYWATIGSQTPAVARADVLTVGSMPAAPTAQTTPDLNSSAVALTFPQAVTASGTPIGPDSYRVERYSTVVPLDEFVVPVTCTVVSAVVTCTEFGVANGHWQYTVTPKVGNWLGTESARAATVLVDSDAPDVAVTYPVAPTAPDVSTRYGPNWTGSITGTVSDAWDNTVSVQVEIQDTTDGLWWDGDTWAATQSRVTPP